MDGLSRSLGLDEWSHDPEFLRKLDDAYRNDLRLYSIFRLTAATTLVLVLLGNHIALSLLKSFLSNSQAGSL